MFTSISILALSLQTPLLEEESLRFVRNETSPEPTWEAVDDDLGLRAEVSADAVELTTPHRSPGAESLRLRFVSWGRGDEAAPLDAATARTSNRRVAIDRGVITEWYVHGDAGLEQGFTIERAPTSLAADGTLRVQLAVEGGFDTRLAPNARSARFVSHADGTTFTYSGLRAWDAAGRNLEVGLSIDAERMSIDVDDARATYPITIDPWIAVERAKLTSDFPNTYEFGVSAALDGNTLLVGSCVDGGFGGEGAAYVFTRSGSTWDKQARLTSPPGWQVYDMGRSVALDGDTAWIGSMHPALQERGPIQIFARTGTTWSHSQTIAPPAPQAWFGHSLDVDGDTAVVGSPWEDNGSLTYRGAGHVYVRQGSSWISQARLLPSSPQVWVEFGTSVTVEGDTIVVGATHQAVAGMADAGVAYVFQRTGSAWTEQAILSAPDPLPFGQFGFDVDLQGDRLVIGSLYQESVYIFERAGAQWTLRAQLTPHDSEPVDRFGASVALDGDRLLVGATGDDDDGYNAGAAYLFTKSGLHWAEASKWTGSAEAYIGPYGDTVAIQGTTAVVSRLGAAFVYELIPQASTTPRDGIGNLPFHRGLSLPVLGGTYRAEVGSLWGGVGGGLWLVGYAAPLRVTLTSGQTLLVDITDPNGELLRLPPVINPNFTEVLDVAIPSDPSLAGMRVYTQAVLFASAYPVNLTNAVDLFLGY